MSFPPEHAVVIGAYLPIKIESVIPHDTAGTDAPLYSARGPSFTTVFFTQSHAPLNVPDGAHCNLVCGALVTTALCNLPHRRRTLMVSNGCPGSCQLPSHVSDTPSLTNYQL